MVEQSMNTPKYERKNWPFQRLKNDSFNRYYFVIFPWSTLLTFCNGTKTKLIHSPRTPTERKRTATWSTSRTYEQLLHCRGAGILKRSKMRTVQRFLRILWGEEFHRKNSSWWTSKCDSWRELWKQRRVQYRSREFQVTHRKKTPSCWQRSQFR